MHIQKYSTKKLKGNWKRFFSHIDRKANQPKKHANKLIDSERTVENINLLGAIDINANLEISTFKRYENLIKPLKTKIDTVSLLAFVLTLPSELNALAREKQIEFFKIGAQKILNWTGMDPNQVIASSIHFDETTPHLHLQISCFDKNKAKEGISCWNLVNKKIMIKNRLKTFHDEIEQEIKKELPELKFCLAASDLEERGKVKALEINKFKKIKQAKDEEILAKYEVNIQEKELLEIEINEKKKFFETKSNYNAKILNLFKNKVKTKLDSFSLFSEQNKEILEPINKVHNLNQKEFQKFILNLNLNLNNLQIIEERKNNKRKLQEKNTLEFLNKSIEDKRAEYDNLIKLSYSEYFEQEKERIGTELIKEAKQEVFFELNEIKKRYTEIKSYYYQDHPNRNYAFGINNVLENARQNLLNNWELSFEVNNGSNEVPMEEVYKQIIISAKQQLNYLSNPQNQFRKIEEKENKFFIEDLEDDYER